MTQLENRLHTKIAPSEVASLLATGQHARAAFVSAKSTPRALAETLAALANSKGGIVALGVTAAGSAQKANDLAALQDLLLRASLLADPPMILPAPRPVTTQEPTQESTDNTEDESAFLLVQIPPGLPHVYNVQGLYLTRAEAHNRPLTTPELRQLLLARGETGFETQPITNATMDDFDTRSIERYLDRLLLLPAEDATETLIARGSLLRDNAGVLRPTVAGMLLFGRNPQAFVRSAEILCVRYPGESMGDEFVRQEIGGTLPEQIRQAEAFVASNMRRETRLDGLARAESAEYPLPVVREAIVNAVAHRDYAVRGEGVRVLLFSNRLEIYSPGRLPGHVTLENIKEERYSRNESIVALLSDLGYIERLGYGIDRMFAVLQAGGLPEPLFEETTAGFQVTLRAAPSTPVASTPVRRRATLAAPDPHTPPYNDRQVIALEIVREQGRITNSELQEMAPDVSAETIRRDLADLVERNILLRIGSKRATYYILK